MKVSQRGERLQRATWPLLLLVGLSFCSEPATAEVAFSQTGEASSESPSDNRRLRLNFHKAPLAQVLDYLSDAAGFVIEKETEVSGTVDCWSKQPVTREEAVALLSSALAQNGCALVRHGRVLTLIRSDQAKTAALEVVVGSHPDEVQPADEMVTQIIPVRYVTASQLVNNLQPLLPASAAMACNDSANALLLVARKSDIRRTLRIVQALDTSLATQSEIRVFTLHNGDAKALAATLPQLFDSSSAAPSSASANSAAQMGNMGPPDFGPPDMPGGASAAGNQAQGSSSSASGKVVAVADEHSNSIIVSAPRARPAEIGRLIRQLDQPAADPKELRLFHLVNADATELASQLATLFPAASSGASAQNATPFFAGPMPPPGMDGGMTGGTSGAGTSSRRLQTGQVIAIADPRTSSLLVSAARELMPQIVRMIAQLDSDVGRNEKVGLFELKNTDPQDANQLMQALFNRNGGGANNNTSQGNSLLGANNPLTLRATQQRQTGSTTAQGAGAGGQAAPGGSTGGGSAR